MRAVLLAMTLTMPAMAQTEPHRSWTGGALRYAPPSADGCNVTIMEAATRNGYVVVTLRQGGTATVSVTLSGELAGNGQRSIATATTRLPAGRNVSVAMMRPYAGSLSGSTLTLRGAACSVVG